LNGTELLSLIDFLIIFGDGILAFKFEMMKSIAIVLLLPYGMMMSANF